MTTANGFADDGDGEDGREYPSQMMAELTAQLEEVREVKGELTPKAVIDVARDRHHPLHSRFEWDNKVAGEKHRLDQAHRLIRSVRIIWVGPDDKERKVRRFIAVPRAHTAQPDYEKVEDVVLDPFKRRIMLREAERRWRTLLETYQHLEGFTEMILATLPDDESD